MFPIPCLGLDLNCIENGNLHISTHCKIHGYSLRTNGLFTFPLLANKIDYGIDAEVLYVALINLIA